MQVNPQQDTLYMLSRKKKFFLRKQEERKLREHLNLKHSFSSCLQKDRGLNRV